MSVRDRLLDLFRGTTPKALPENAPNARLTFQETRVGKSSVNLFRHWAEHGEWVRAAINIRKSQVSQSEWDIGPYDPDKDYPKREASRLRELFKTPNPQDGDFRTFAEKIVEDLLVLDAGAVEKVRGLGGRTVEMWPVDGGEVRINRYWDGDPEEARYYWYPGSTLQEAARWRNDEFIYLMQNPRTYTPVGLAPLETLKIAVDSELGGMAYNKRQVEGAAPDGIINLGEGVRPEKVDEFRAYWDAEVAGRGAMAFIGGTKGPGFIDFRKSNRDMQFLEWQIYLVRKIAAVFQLTPQDLGVTFDVNRSSAEVQADQSEDRGLRPLLGLIQSAFTREVVWSDEFGGPGNNLAFRFTRLNMKESKNRADINEKALAGMPWKTIDEARREDGREPLGGMYSELMANTSQGVVLLTDIATAREVTQSPPGDGNGGSDGNPARPTSKTLVQVQEE